MTIEEYQELSKRTNADLGSELMNALHMTLGLQTEVAEISDAYKKHIAYGKDLDLVNIKEEVGDTMFYIVNLCNNYNWDLMEICKTNIAKLQARYPEKFTEENAINRDLDKEREILESPKQ
mgnify:CR=1 FL=1